MPLITPLAGPANIDIHRFLDVLHSAFVCATVWYYLVTGLGNISALSRVHWYVRSLKILTTPPNSVYLQVGWRACITISLIYGMLTFETGDDNYHSKFLNMKRTVAVAHIWQGVITFVIHCFFAYRVWTCMSLFLMDTHPAGLTMFQ